ncbi:hypothetical protein [Rhodovibrio salinarum]|uniref:Uncharacterized protein n=1 Tax=Rhodovibrio salinarum TaxID=1087 RepID=A0A934QL09_9PROT|nr:hypothetical protein [Rhodovibrio salinarum]MBK1698836.1 hypothetical protein [Rhodovibrio salinarum]
MSDQMYRPPGRMGCETLQVRVSVDFQPLIFQACPRCTGHGSECLIDLLTAIADDSSGFEASTDRGLDHPHVVQGGYRFARH